jgi:serine/threonine protein kinase
MAENIDRPADAGAAPQPDTVDVAPGPSLCEQATLPPTPSAVPAQPARPAFDKIVRGFGDYELLGELGRGGMGVVYQARERRTGRLVALKMMLGESVAAETDLRRFELEARATGELNHPGIVTIHAWGEQAGHPFYTMDFVQGVPLSQLLQAGPLPIERAVRYLLGISRAVAAAHAQGIFHRDLKPGNVIIDASDQPRVLDFGLAKRRQSLAREEAAADDIVDVLPASAPLPAPPPARPCHSEPITAKGAILGTPSYMAPEQVRADHRNVAAPADVHALGAIFYEMLTGRPPFVGAGGTVDTLIDVLEKKPAPLRKLNRRVPVQLESVCACCLEKDPDDRYPDAGALADDLELRWARLSLSQRFGHLTQWAVLAVGVIQVLQLLLADVLLPDPQGLIDTLAVRAKAGPALREAATVLIGVLDKVVFIAAPLLAGVGLVAWLAAWLWYRERVLLPCLLIGFLTLPLFGFWCLVDRPLAETGHFLLPYIVAAAGLAALATGITRWWTRAERGPQSTTARASDPYLQRLFVPRGASAQGLSPVGEGGAGFADFELGKVLHSWSEGEARWARQNSLDRPVLVWLDKRKLPPDAPPPGVVLRHPDVLALHCLGMSGDGNFLVTEPVAATPLQELLDQRQLEPAEAVNLASRLALALQGFHDQGTVHGRLSPDWILVRGDLEPVLCPYGVPTPSPKAPGQDVKDLGTMLSSWLPARRRFGQRHWSGPLYRVCDAAREGRYERAADLAGDLGQALRAASFRWQQRWINIALLLFLALPLFGLAGEWLVDRAASGHGPELTVAHRPLRSHLLFMLCPGALLLGVAHARTMLQNYRARLSPAARGRVLGTRDLASIAPLVLLALGAIVLNLPNLPGDDPEGSYLARLVLFLGTLLGFWLIGVFAVAIVAFAQAIRASLTPLETKAEA